MNFDRIDFSIAKKFHDALVHDNFDDLDANDDELLCDFIDSVRDKLGLGHFDAYPREKRAMCEITNVIEDCIEIVYCTPNRK